MTVRTFVTLIAGFCMGLGLHGCCCRCHYRCRCCRHIGGGGLCFQVDPSIARMPNSGPRTRLRVGPRVHDTSCASCVQKPHEFRGVVFTLLYWFGFRVGTRQGVRGQTMSAATSHFKPAFNAARHVAVLTRLAFRPIWKTYCSVCCFCYYCSCYCSCSCYD